MPLCIDFCRSSLITDILQWGTSHGIAISIRACGSVELEQGVDADFRHSLRNGRSWRSDKRLRTAFVAANRPQSARQAKAERMAASLPRRSSPLAATCSDGEGHPGVAGKSDWHESLVFARSDVDGACLCSRSRERDPLGDSARTRGSDGEGVLHSPG